MHTTPPLPFFFIDFHTRMSLYSVSLLVLLFSLVSMCRPSSLPPLPLFLTRKTSEWSSREATHEDEKTIIKLGSIASNEDFCPRPVVPTLLPTPSIFFPFPKGPHNPSLLPIPRNIQGIYKEQRSN